MQKTAIRVGPGDDGQPMSLLDFEHAEGQDGYLYELGRGTVVVTDVPKRRHLNQVLALKRQLFAYDAAHPGRIHTIATGSECKILLDDLQSERHPDLAVYLTPPPDEDDREIWNTWIPEIVVEVVSPSSRHRDHVEKREEYLSFGVREYWIVDADRGEIRILRRSRGRWAERIVSPARPYRTGLLPGFELDGARVLDAAE
jgi:Uma2 family endonuclease